MIPFVYMHSKISMMNIITGGGGSDMNSIKVTGYSLLINVYEKILPSFSSCRIQACMCLTLPLKKLY